ncbi:MAG: 8-amino-7-oxononanoate synthase [Betaproteobacteria bacterium]|jgi:8-amino-7-oxononanoate synthase|nr:8-amino-7-oxononanoate synthase [Betaproteobacteria bacterium]
MKLEQELAQELAAREAQGLRRVRRRLDSPQRARVEVDGRPCIAFCANDYLGLAADPRLAAAARESLMLHGVGAGASHLILGHSRAHQALEEALAAFSGYPAALLFSTGYMANLGAISALVGRGDAVFADRLNHASLNDAALLSRATFRRYAHNDLDALERLLATTPARRRLVATDAVFSMDGDIAPVPELMALCERHDALLYLDDAHGFGVLGEQGRGTLSHFGVSSSRIVYMATLGKAAGVSGAFVAASGLVVETLLQNARTYTYTTAAPPLLAHTLLTSLELIAREEPRREQLRARIAQLREGLAGLPWQLLPSRTPIQPLIVGDNAAALALSARLAEQDILVPAIRPPTVPPGTARLRISLSSDHGAADVACLVAALRAAA